MLQEFCRLLREMILIYLVDLVRLAGVSALISWDGLSKKIVKVMIITLLIMKCLATVHVQ